HFASDDSSGDSSSSSSSETSSDDLSDSSSDHSLSAPSLDVGIKILLNDVGVTAALIDVTTARGSYYC
ncbi:hypothetical protein Tco_1350775, partial [Tanacetum coccineum]